MVRIQVHVCSMAGLHLEANIEIQSCPKDDQSPPTPSLAIKYYLRCMLLNLLRCSTGTEDLWDPCEILVDVWAPSSHILRNRP